MYRGTTPTLSFTINSELDMDTIVDVWVTFQGIGTNKFSLTKKIDDLVIEDKTISISLTQEETLSFKGSETEVQLKFLFDNSQVYISDKYHIQLFNPLNTEVMKGD